MPAARYLFRVVSGVPVITAPGEIGISSAGELSAALLQAAAGGHATVVVDMTGTWLCDPAGLNLLVRAHSRALADGGGLRLVIPGGTSVIHIFGVTGVGRVIPRFASVEEALAQVPASAVPPPRPGHPPLSPAGPARRRGPRAGNRFCEECGIAFVPQHARVRFCGVACRATWNREQMGDPAVEASALQWSIAAMSEATGRLPGLTLCDRLRGLAAIREAVWWIALVDATLVRHHRDLYDAVMAGDGAAAWRATEETLAGLRFARDWITREAGIEGLIRSEDAGTTQLRIAAWTWNKVPPPARGWLASRGQAWEMARYRAYQAQLAGHTIGETVRRAAAFLALTGASAGPAAAAGAADAAGRESASAGSQASVI